MIYGFVYDESEGVTSASRAEKYHQCTKMDEAQPFEAIGCEGPLRCIFLCEFHPIAGPKITCQVPSNYISKEIFDAASVYIIPKAQLQRSILTVTLLESKILGYPIRIDSKKYARNAFHFNLCFVCDAWARSVQYEPVVRKLSDYLANDYLIKPNDGVRTPHHMSAHHSLHHTCFMLVAQMQMEVDSHFLSKADLSEKDKDGLPSMLKQVLHDLNTYRMCILTQGTTTLHLKLVPLSKEPGPVQDHHVPIFVEDQDSFQEEQWDLTTYQVLPYIDGFNHVARIAAEADVENNLVKACVQNLMYHGVVTIIPIFQYSNVYAATPYLRRLAENKDLQQRCINYVSKSARQPPTLRDIFRMYSSMAYGTTVRDLCIRLNPHPLRINERKLVQFGVLEGLIRRVNKYPVNLAENHGASTAHIVGAHYRSFSGLCSMDEICCTYGLSMQQLEDEVEKDPNVVVIWK